MSRGDTLRLSRGETFRLLALQETAQVDTPPDGRLDCITALAANLFDTPIAFISLVDEHREWIKSGVGLGEVTVEDRRVGGGVIGLGCTEIAAWYASLCFVAFMCTELTPHVNV